MEPSIGTVRFVAVYFASLLAGSLGVVILGPDAFEVTAGASGAVFGLFAAAFVLARGRGMQDVSSQLGFVIVLNLVFTFSIPGISIGGHLGGLVGGAICALVILAGDRRMLPGPRIPVEVAAIVLIGAACAIAAITLAEVPPGLRFA
jgi:membrane associated rhomboid family serine protease